MLVDINRILDSNCNIITIILHIPNIICIALNDWHAWYTIIASICALALNSYLIYYLIKHEKNINNS